MGEVDGTVEGKVDEIFLDFPDMANRPNSVYAARVKGVDNQGKSYTRTRLFIRKATMENMVARFKEYAGPGYEVETFEGEIVWSDKVKAKEKKARKKKGQELGLTSAVAQDVGYTHAEVDQSPSPGDWEAKGRPGS